MVLHPLAEVRIRVFVTVMVCGGKFVMHILRSRKRREAQKKTDEDPHRSCAQHGYIGRRCGIRIQTQGYARCPKPAEGKLLSKFCQRCWTFRV